jgi:hypothetical protein
MNITAVSIREMAVRWTIKEATVKGDLRTYQLVWYLVTRIEHDSPSVHNFISRFL